MVATLRQSGEDLNLPATLYISQRRFLKCFSFDGWHCFSEVDSILPVSAGGLKPATIKFLATMIKFLANLFRGPSYIAGPKRIQ